MLDSVPLITITGQVPCGMIGAYAFQETPIVEEESMRLPGYMSRMPKPPKVSHLEHIVRLVSESKKPVLYVSGGCLNSSRVPSSTRKKSARDLGGCEILRTGMKIKGEEGSREGHMKP
ncbi:hypothetical protein F2Q70_00040498 [Brassica cretica]|uniref:Thiamine pyrophosphate enzyme central domain-containing protein n=2 Tax=Brassica cretica TaxID=69181 RepID=A0A3N6QRZ4_BRACR|nr:hypothetical protein F2Q70_00040498 [Brassica cretica]KAF2616925.1 hypothetical protein F2Q68_00041145 [Brassica cretica]KAF3493800.1 hypothetical protein DY000_02055549 [Brassica cretica]